MNKNNKFLYKTCHIHFSATIYAIVVSQTIHKEHFWGLTYKTLLRLDCNLKGMCMQKI